MNMKVKFAWCTPHLDSAKKDEFEHEIVEKISQHLDEHQKSAEVIVYLHEEYEEADRYRIRGNAVCVEEGQETELIKEIRINEGFLIEFTHHSWFSTRTL